MSDDCVFTSAFSFQTLSRSKRSWADRRKGKTKTNEVVYRDNWGQFLNGTRTRGKTDEPLSYDIAENA